MKGDAPGHSRAFALLLRVYPRRYRQRYGDDMRVTFGDTLAAARAQGSPEVRRLWWRSAVDVVRTGLAERWRSSLDPTTGGSGDGRSPWARRGPRAAARLFEDLRHAARTLRRAPAYTVFAVVTLALGIGATTAGFSVVDRVVLRPLPYPGSERMVLVGPSREMLERLRPRQVATSGRMAMGRDDPARPGTVSAPLMVALQETPGPAEAIVGISRGYSVLTGLGDAERVWPAQVTCGFLPFFGARAQAGRLFTEEDHAPGAARVAVLGHGFWTSRYGGDPAAVGSTILLDGNPHTVVGVLSRDFVAPEQIMDPREEDIWVPLPLAERIAASPGDQLRIFETWAVARLPDAGLAEAMAAHASRIIDEVYAGMPRTPSMARGGATTEGLHLLTVGEITSVLWRVLAAVALLLVIACVNVGSLLLARVSDRAGELAIRATLGAGRLRLVRHLLSECLIVALLASGLGAAIAWLVVAGFGRFAPRGPGSVPRLAEVMVDGRALTFSLVVALGTVVLFGLVPALRATRRLASSGSQITEGRREGRLRAALVFAETALAVVLVVASGLVVHDLVRRTREDPGYCPEGLIAVDVSLPYDRFGYGGDRVDAFWRDLLEGARALPDVVSAALTTELPTTSFDRTDMRPEGRQESEMIATAYVDGNFAATIGIRLAEGTWFTGATGETSVVVNQAFVAAYWPEVPSAVGRTIQIGDTSWRVAGVAMDARARPGIAPGPKVFFPLADRPPPKALVARADGDAAALAPALRVLVMRLDPDLVDVDIWTLAALNAATLARPRFYTTLFAGFGLTAFILALVGVYGTTAYAVRSRTREIGIRMALGAPRSRVITEVMARTVIVLATGVTLGLVAAAFASRALSDMLVTVEPRDAFTYTVAGVLVLAAGAAATLVPAERASRVDPAVTLRDDG